MTASIMNNEKVILNIHSEESDLEESVDLKMNVEQIQLSNESIAQEKCKSSSEGGGNKVIKLKK